MLVKKFFALIILSAMIFVPFTYANAQENGAGAEFWFPGDPIFPIPIIPEPSPTAVTSLSMLWVQNLEESQAWGFGTSGEGRVGKGVLIDAERKLAVTARSIVRDADFVFVSFPAPFNAPDALIENDPDHYRDEYLERIGSGDGTWARVIAKDSHRDLAILQLDGIPAEAIAISQNATAVPAAGDTLHLLNSTETDAWNWVEGEVDKAELGWIHVDPYLSKESTGGPVLNDDGDLVGIAVFEGQRTGSSAWNRAWVAPIEYINQLLDDVEPHHTFRIKNLQPLDVPYQVKWSESGEWREFTLSPGASRTHWSSMETIQEGYPKVFHFRNIRNGSIRELLQTLTLDTRLRYFGDDYGDQVTRYDAFKYVFEVDVWNPHLHNMSSMLNRSADEVTCMPIDVNDDGVTDINDLKAVILNLTSSNPHPDADVDKNGDVDTTDLIYAIGLRCDVAASPSLMTTRDIAALEHSLTTVADQVAGIPDSTALLANYPNPFNPETWIPYQLSEPAQVTMHIYAADGRLVRTLNLGHQSAGMYEDRSSAAYWDGRNETGEQVASGLYFYTLTAGDFSATRKMLIAK